MKPLKIILLEPFFSGSHKQWADGFKDYSRHQIEILSLPGRHWKWRMHGGAISLAKQFNEIDYTPDLILATSMLDLTTFLSLTREKSSSIPVAIYVHENQLTYPWSPQDRDVKNKRDNHYAFINYTSVLVADKVFFNSEYHQHSFLGALPEFLNQFPDKKGKDNIQVIKNKSEVLHLGMDLARFDKYESLQKRGTPIILWNHRWEYDKRPKPFFTTLYKLKEKGIPFKLAVLGERNEMIPKSFEEAKVRLADEIIHWGFVDSFQEYASWLWKADILPVTSKQDFFGGSVVEAMYCNCFPLLPKRLAYPEHLAEDMKNKCLYSEGELLEKLEPLLLGIKTTREMKFQSMVSKYDWKEIIAKYDKYLSK